MLLFAAALYPEAAPLIDFLHLKKDPAFRAFDLFTSADAALIITGCGPANAAAGTACLLTARPPKSSDSFVNFGICGCCSRDTAIGTPYLACRITDAGDGRTYYPDLLYASPFAEAGITSFSKPVSNPAALPRLPESSAPDPGQPIAPSGRKQWAYGTLPYGTLPYGTLPYGNLLFDMEAAACYQSARHFLMQHQMIFCKVVSDYGTSDRPAPDAVADLLKEPAASLTAWLSGLPAPDLSPDPFTESDHEAIRTASERLKLSEAMHAQLIRLMTYASLTGHSPAKLLAFFAAPEFTCTSKKEGKRYFEQLKYRLSGQADL